MAKDTAKKNLRRNDTRMYIFTLITIAVNVIYVLRIMYRNGGLPGFRDLLAIVFWVGQEYLAFSALQSVVRPKYNDQGELVECIDASNPHELGYFSFAQDVLWVCWVIQLLCCFHGAFFVFYLPVPATVIYKVWHLLLRPLLVARYGWGAEGGNENDNSQGSEAPRNRQKRRAEELRQRKSRR